MYFLKKYKNKIILVVVMSILIITIGITNNKKMEMTNAENFVGNIFAPINKLFYGMGSKISDQFGNIKGLFGSNKVNEDLEIEILKLEDENRILQNIIGKSDFLKAEAELLKKSDLNLISAKVISKEPGNWYSKFKIDRGKKDGIKKGDIIIQGINIDARTIEEGLIGRVESVGDNFANISSVVNGENSVSFKTIRTQDGGMVAGNIDSTMEGYLFDRKADVLVGDKLYTSGLGEGYISDIYIGEIEEVIQLEEELMKKIIVKPAIDFKKIYRVFVIKE